MHHKGIYSNTFPAVGVDMIHHETDILLRIGRTRITIKNVGAQISLTVVFDRFGTWKFSAVICKADFKKCTKTIRMQFKVKPLEDIEHRRGIIVITEKSKHEFCFYKVNSKVNSKKNLIALVSSTESSWVIAGSG